MTKFFQNFDSEQEQEYGNLNQGVLHRKLENVHCLSGPL